MAKKCCENCVYSKRPTSHWLRVILSRWPGLLMCFNCAACPGELTETRVGATCRNFRARREAVVRLAAPEPPNDKIRYIPLTKGKFATVDAEDYERLMKHKWTAYYTCGKWYAGRNEKGKCILMHREIMHPPKGKVVHHVDGNGLNNCKCNLLICTYGQNNCNRRPRGKTSRFKGVMWDKRRNLWRATAWDHGRSVHVGRYTDELEAARACDDTNVKLNGPYAYLNFPADWPPEKRQAVYEDAQREKSNHGDTEAGKECVARAPAGRR